MKDTTKILFIAQEIDPYVCETEISTICRQFSQYIQEKGFEIRIFMPCFGHINERRNQLHEVQRLSGMNIIIDDSDNPLIIKVASIQSARMQVYFIGNDDYFRRRGISSDEKGKYFEDNDERAIFFVRSVLETIKKLRWTPDIIHCSGWITALAPLYIKKAYNTDPFFENSKVLYSIYKESFEVPMKAGFDKRVMFDGVEAADIKPLKGRVFKTDNLHKVAIKFSDGVICGSDTIKPELERFIKKNKVPYLPYAEEPDFRERYAEYFKGFFPEK